MTNALSCWGFYDLGSSVLGYVSAEQFSLLAGVDLAVHHAARLQQVSVLGLVRIEQMEHAEGPRLIASRSTSSDLCLGGESALPSQARKRVFFLLDESRTNMSHGPVAQKGSGASRRRVPLLLSYC